MTVRLVVGAPVWNRAWALPTYFDSLEANVDKRQTGLVFVVPPSDSASRDVINDRATGYAFVEVIRDRHEQFDRGMRRRDSHASLAEARNALLRHVCQVGPEWFLSWDSDFLVSPGVVERVMAAKKPLTTVWAWLNRRPPQRGQHWDEEAGRFVPVEWNEPVNATAMDWEDRERGIAVHKDPRRWAEFAQGLWRCDVALAWQLMHRPVYGVASYQPHPHGEDIPFNWQLEQRGIERWCYGQEPGLHLFNREEAEREAREGYPAIMERATEDLPLAATRPEPESESLRMVGFFEQTQDSLAPS